MSTNILSTDCLHRQLISTPLGPMLAIADAENLLLLEFTSRVDVDAQVETLGKLDSRPIFDGSNPILEQVQQELELYFSGSLSRFFTPVKIQGSTFQETVWNGLTQIPYGQTVSYQQLGKRIGYAQAARAVGSANGQNRIAILIPCHRVIRADGSSGGYAGGIKQKQWLLNHESTHLTNG